MKNQKQKIKKGRLYSLKVEQNKKFAKFLVCLEEDDNKYFVVIIQKLLNNNDVGCLRSNKFLNIHILNMLQAKYKLAKFFQYKWIMKEDVEKYLDGYLGQIQEETYQIFLEKLKQVSKINEYNLTEL